MVSMFLYLLQFLSYDVIMTDADCTPGREPRSVAASLELKWQAVDDVVMIIFTTLSPIPAISFMDCRWILSATTTTTTYV